MAQGFLARIARLEKRVDELGARLGDVEDVQHEQGRRFARALRVVLTTIRRQGTELRRFQNRTEKAIRDALSVATPRS